MIEPTVTGAGALIGNWAMAAPPARNPTSRIRNALRTALRKITEDSMAICFLPKNSIQKSLLRPASLPGRVLERKLSFKLHQAASHLDIAASKILIRQHILRKRLARRRVLETQAQVGRVAVVE